MLIGEYIYIIDDKKRVAIPPKMRSELGKSAVLTRGLDNCLVLYPLKEWQNLSKKMAALPAGQINARGFTRVVLSGAIEVGLDKLGRILIPDHLKKYAFLKKNVAIIGVSNRVEIWDEARWQEYKAKMEKTVGEMAQQIGI